MIPPLLLQIRILIFPNNSLGPSPPPPPSAEQARKIRSRAASDILSLIPKPVARIFFAINGELNTDEDGEKSMQSEIEERMLGWTDDAELNKYLIYAILEHIVVKLVPELREKTPSELLAERGVDLLDYRDEELAEMESSDA